MQQRQRIQIFEEHSISDLMTKVNNYILSNEDKAEIRVGELCTPISSSSVNGLNSTKYTVMLVLNMLVLNWYA
jgi:hypothetical protein